MFTINNTSPAHQAQDLVRLFPDSDVLGTATAWRDEHQAAIDDHQFLIGKNDALVAFLRQQAAETDRVVQEMVGEIVSRRDGRLAAAVAAGAAAAAETVAEETVAAPAAPLSAALKTAAEFNMWHPWRSEDDNSSSGNSSGSLKKWITRINVNTTQLANRVKYLASQVATIDRVIAALVGMADVDGGLPTMMAATAITGTAITDRRRRHPKLVFMHDESIAMTFFEDPSGPAKTHSHSHRVWDEDYRARGPTQGHFVHKYPGYYSGTDPYIHGFDVLPVVVVVRPDGGLYACKRLAFYCDSKVNLTADEVNEANEADDNANEADGDANDDSDDDATTIVNDTTTSNNNNNGHRSSKVTPTKMTKFYTTITAIPPASTVLVTMLPCWPAGHVELTADGDDGGVDGYTVSARLSDSLIGQKNYTGRTMFRLRVTAEAEVEFRPTRPWLDEPAGNELCA